ncbi:DUF4435 domain-containing protein [uncultured Muribaculum sp.]|uniref:DUF4435 domain-containing protein n=1 Tax=uncultured Muribaculum sp. TaxID=1918613 RepID=UPI0025E96F30|nr:DUF4435 domain-containing protein [uncultured Muribaculum sp.]
MKLTLPPQLDSTRATLEGDAQRIIIIGANGSGKTRFTARLAADASERHPVFRVSALTALYACTDPDTREGSVDMLYESATERSPFMRGDHHTQFERVMALLLLDEVLHLLLYKYSGGDMEPTCLDRVIGAWQDVFPDSRILREGGRLLFSRKDDGDAYSQMRLSDGEKAVLYIFGAAVLAPQGAVVFVNSPEMFLHPSIMGMIWDKVEALRPDCTWIYTTHNVEFVASRPQSTVVWVRGYDAEAQRWDYAVLPAGAPLDDEIYTTIVGARKPVLFIEGDGSHSIDAKLYPLVFTNYTVRSLGSCNKVIEATRTFNDLNSFHHLDSHGIVDRDRRDAHEVAYLRKKRIFVPDVAEIENILMLEEVVRAVAHYFHRNEDRVFDRVRKAVINMFRGELKQQALMHARHRVKRMVEYRIDGRFPTIDKFEEHIADLVHELRPRDTYNQLVRDFRGYVDGGDYQSVLRVYNQKSMVSQSNVANMCGLKNHEAYVAAIIDILMRNVPEADRIRRAVTRCFGITADDASAKLPDISATEAD